MDTVPAIDMKNTPLTTILLGVLTLSALASVVLCWLYISNTRELRSLQAQAAQINSNRALINALATDAIEYSKTHQDIEHDSRIRWLETSQAGPRHSPANPQPSRFLWTTLTINLLFSPM